MNLIAAVDEKWGIGYKENLLFSIPEDMAFFKKITSNKVVIMGHSTLKALPNSKPLPNRINIVLSRDENLKIEGASVCHSIEELFQKIKGYKEEELFVIGGEKIYRALLSHCKVAYITKIYSSKRADTFLDNLDVLRDWRLIEKTDKQIYENLTFDFNKYIKIGI